MSVYGYMHVNAGACGSQKRVSALLELGLQATVSSLMCVLGTTLFFFFFTRAVHVFNPGASSLATTHLTLWDSTALWTYRFSQTGWAVSPGSFLTLGVQECIGLLHRFIQQALYWLHHLPSLWALIFFFLNGITLTSQNKLRIVSSFMFCKNVWKTGVISSGLETCWLPQPMLGGEESLLERFRSLLRTVKLWVVVICLLQIHGCWWRQGTPELQMKDSILCCCCCCCGVSILNFTYLSS